MPTYKATKQQPNQPPSKPLSNWGNTPGRQDQYGNNLWKSGDEYPPFSNRDPAGSGAGSMAIGIGAPAFGPYGVENPYAGDFTEAGDGNRYCDTCQQAISVIDLIQPYHLGHNVRYGDAKSNFDVNNMPRTGGEYRISYCVDRNPMSASPDPLESTLQMPDMEAEARINTIADNYGSGANGLNDNLGAIRVPDRIPNPEVGPSSSQRPDVSNLSAGAGYPSKTSNSQRPQYINPSKDYSY